MRDQRRGGAEACRCGRSLTSGVAAADYDDIEALNHVPGYVIEPPQRVKKRRDPPVRFHVKRRSLRPLPEESGLESEKVNALFTNTEIAENLVQYVLDVHPARQSAKCLRCNA